jgi:hypothetical protein
MRQQLNAWAHENYVHDSPSVPMSNVPIKSDDSAPPPRPQAVAIQP